LLSQIYLTL
jgi:hypothetical protein